ncbi:hypothetical protein LJC53_06910 [Bacteroidales bacterium OttesenSCG-928-C03]|nr:hypothetical protein [Bacteroidales bacterium OttesenSCG-928-C03]
MRILKVLVAVIVILFLLYHAFIFGWLGERKHLISPYIDTQFAPNYSPKKFDKIKVGMMLNEVESIIGKPFHARIPPMSYHIDNDSTKNEYDYTGDGKLLDKMQEQGKRYYYDCAWYRSLVIFDTNNIVVEINKGWNYD